MAHALNNNTIVLEEAKQCFREKYEFLISVLPDANPKFLEEKCKKYYKDENEFYHFITESIKKKKYPLKKDYERKLEINKQKKFYNSDFKIEEFITYIPNPEEYFNERNTKRINKLKNLNFEEKYYVYTFLKNYFSHLYTKHITSVYREKSYDLLQTFQCLKNSNKQLRRERKQIPASSEEAVSVDLIIEIAYIKRHDDIWAYINNKKMDRDRAVIEAGMNNLLYTCKCCYDEEILFEEIVSCENRHIFCLDCTKKFCEVMLEQGKQEFPCLLNCGKFFDINNLKMVLPTNVFSNIYKANQLKEIKAAAIENLNCCPHCDFAAIVPKGLKVFTCLNPECMAETCLLCQEPSHVPLRCGETEKPADVKIRTDIENQMTEALVRTCYKCNRKFLKEDGCNKMKCLCGALMCYVCKQPVKDYSHFNGAGGDKYDLCPLFSDTNQLHANNVLQEAQKVRQTYGNKLKNDPTKDIESHYKRKKIKSCGGINCRD